jgi:hypothetical protein
MWIMPASYLVVEAIAGLEAKTFASSVFLSIITNLPGRLSWKIQIKQFL